jgi:hypothetical protein
MQARSIGYWTSTILVAFFIGTGGLGQLWQYHANPDSIVPVLLYPMYFFAILGIWKVLGAIAILVPGRPLLKEWAYAGIFFDLTGAAASYIGAGSYGAHGFHVIVPLLFAGITVASWALRPASRSVASPETIATPA